MNNNSMDMNKLMEMLSKMDKSQLEAGLKQVQKIIDSKSQNNK